MADLVDTTEMYLRTILDLEEEGIVPLRARISERLGHSGPTVSQTIARMERLGLVVVTSDRRLVLTEEGLEKATRVLRKHRLAELLLSNVIGLDIAQVHDEACRWEHVISDEAEKRIFDLLGKPSESPYGTPIPGLEEFGVEPAETFLTGVVSVAELLYRQAEVDAAAGPSAVARALGAANAAGMLGVVSGVLRRLGEPLQTDIALLERFVELGIQPGVEISVELDGRDALIYPRELGKEKAARITVEMLDHVYVLDEADKIEISHGDTP